MRVSALTPTLARPGGLPQVDRLVVEFSQPQLLGKHGR